MIEGAINRIPAASHWETFQQAEHQYPDVIASLMQAVRSYAEDKPEFNSTSAGPAVLDSWPKQEEWNRCFGGQSSQLFGMVAWVAFYDHEALWRVSTQTVNGRQVRIYSRVNPG